MLFGKLSIDPLKNPAILDTATWDRDAAGREIIARRDTWLMLHEDVRRGVRGSDRTRRPAPHAVVEQGGCVSFLTELDDGQQVFIRIGDVSGVDALGEPFVRCTASPGVPLAAYPTDASVIDRYCRTFKPLNAPATLGGIPRLGIGSRMTTRVWPGVFAAMQRKGFAANPIQNSVRELNLLDDLTSGREPERNYASGFGMIESGYTGSTFEGLWVWGALAALRHDTPLTYGADADHIQVKRADAKFVHATRVIEAARHYTFFTLDLADILSFELLLLKGEGEAILGRTIVDERQRRDILSYHTEPLKVGRRWYRLEADMVGRCVGKFWRSLESADLLHARIAQLRGTNPFDLEFAFDEHPPEVSGPGSISSEEEVVFVTRELVRRGLPVTHLAPNFGIEKGFDYRLADGLAGFQARVESIHRIAEETGFLLDFHSADDLSGETRRVIGRATGRRMHFKISPVLHFLLAETVRDHAPELFLAWWNDALSYARAEAENGSVVAAGCLSAYQSSPDPSPSPAHEVFRQFFFAFPGRRDAAGRFVNREAFYALSAGTCTDYQERVAAHLCTLADDLFTV
jgi:hypothetical protein